MILNEQITFPRIKKKMTDSAPERFLDSVSELSISTSNLAINNTISSIEESDFYSFSIGGSSSFELSLDSLSANANVKLIKDKNGDGEFSRSETIAYSNKRGRKAESISTRLIAGNYLIEVNTPRKNVEIDYVLNVSLAPFDNAGNTLNDAREIALDSQTKTIRDWVGDSDSKDYYKFKLENSSSLEIELNDLSADADLQLLDSQGNILASSVNLNSLSEALALTLEVGSYYIGVDSYNNSETFYSLELSASELPAIIPTSVNDATTDSGATTGSSATPTSATTQQTADNTRTVAGDLRANTFTFQSGYSRTVFSGNGNVDYGDGLRDLLNLSQFASNSVTFNYADSNSGGVAYNPGNGTRMFDFLSLSDGSEIYFEGIEAIKFADTTINLSIRTDDTEFDNQWNLHMMGVHNAWRFTTGSNNVLVGIQDTGLGDINGNTHPDLGKTYFLDDNYIDEKFNVNTDDSHGTLVQGTIAAQRNNGTGIAGIVDVNVMHVDVVGGNNDDYNFVTATQAMIDRANAQGQTLVVNMSLAGPSSTKFEQLIANNKNKALFVISSGNTGENSLASPAHLAGKYDNVIAVGASWGTTDHDDDPATPGDRISYSWWGSAYGEDLTVMAPSEFMSTSVTRDASDNFKFGYDDNFNGTSAAAPNVSGVAALIWSVNPNLTAVQIKEIISTTAFDLNDPGDDVETGNGFINADAAVRRALALGKGYA